MAVSLEYLQLKRFKQLKKKSPHFERILKILIQIKNKTQIEPSE
jgi:hypothetical protein